MQEDITKAQSLILRDLKNMPKRLRRPSGAIPVSATSHFDARSMSGLFQKGFISHDQNGNIVIIK